MASVADTRHFFGLAPFLKMQTILDNLSLINNIKKISLGKSCNYTGEECDLFSKLSILIHSDF